MSAAPVSKLGFFEVRTRDVERLAAYYEQALGLAPAAQDGALRYFTTGPEHHCVVVAEGEPHGRARLGFELAGGLEDAAAGLARAGVAAERRADPEPGLAEALVLAEPVTGTPIVLYERQAPSGAAEAAGVRPARLGHLAGFVSDLGAVRGFYEELLGFRWADTVGDFFVFLRCNADHHAINLIETTARTGLFHVAFEMRDVAHLTQQLDRLSGHGVRLDWGPGRHGPGHNVFTYHADPDGNTVELFCELDVVCDEQTGQYAPRPWHESSPMLPKVWEPTPDAANLWGPQNPDPGFLAH